MYIRRWLIVVCLPLFLSTHAGVAMAECQESSGGGEVAGTVLGAVIGGLVGSTIGGGTGKKIAIGAGVLAGGFAGNRIGAALDCRDQRQHNQSAQDAFETRETGTASTWRNPDTGHAGSITPTKTYQREDGVYCREFEQTIVVDGRTERGYGTACRQPDATWKVVG